MFGFIHGICRIYPLNRILAPNQETVMETTAILNYQKIWQSVVNNRISMYHRIDPLAVLIKRNFIKHSMPIVVCIRRWCVGTRQIALNKLNSMFFFLQNQANRHRTTRIYPTTIMQHLRHPKWMEMIRAMGIPSRIKVNATILPHQIFRFQAPALVSLATVILHWI